MHNARSFDDDKDGQISIEDILVIIFNSSANGTLN